MSSSTEPRNDRPTGRGVRGLRHVVEKALGRLRPHLRPIAVALTAATILAVTVVTGRFARAQERYDFTFALIGPISATQGYPLFWAVESELTAGERDFAYYEPVNLPQGVTVSYPDLDEKCCTGNRAWKPSPTLVRLLIDESATPGDYDVEFTLTSMGVVRRASHLLRIQAAPLGQLAVAPALPAAGSATGSKRRAGRVNGPGEPSSPRANEHDWRSKMLARARELCNSDDIVSQGMWSGNVWFYDGIRVFHQIAEYTADPSWYACADYVKGVYSSYVIQNKGRVPGYYVFTQGLLLDWLRTADPQSKEAILLLATSSPFAQVGGRVHNGLARDTAFVMEAYLDAEAVGAPRNPRLERAAGFALGHLDQWFVSSTPQKLQPYMVGLLCEALIQYHAATADPRVLPAIEIALDGLWETAWIDSESSFYYESLNPKREAPDLNLLIAPAYAWVFAMTGDEEFRSRSIRIFDGGVAKGSLASGKHFSQAYRWSFSYFGYADADPIAEGQ